MNAEKVAALAGTYSLLMILGALGFQYIGGVLPCEMCHWQRWPHDGAIVVGIGGALLYAAGLIDRKIVTALAALALLLIAVSGGIGAYQALVEWKLVLGPASCTGPRFVLGAHADLNGSVVRCDVAGWRLFGISLAGYNALISWAVVCLGALALLGKLPLPSFGNRHD
ncbi:MAG: disulfide bond formation protein B [Alphaproteobacteria bacterium]|nr:disulfide bond formation protein B [Alphaproteobacteria bacterium]